MKILIAPDKFKGSLTAQQVCDAVEEGLKIKYPDSNYIKFPMADGGEGTADILTSICGGQKIKAPARDPLFRNIEASYGLSPDGTTAFIEMASASGLLLLKPEERNPILTSTIGTGDLILDALERGVASIILGCGGSATHDVGMGMAVAMGVKFYDAYGLELLSIGKSLKMVSYFTINGLQSNINDCRFTVIADVDNPLLGLNGATEIFSRQKGASNHAVEELESGTKHFIAILEKKIPGISNFRGAGAGGGFPVSAKAFLNASHQRGIDFVMNFSHIEDKIKQCDLVITGEGKFDAQSLNGKVVSGIARLCKQHEKKLWVICGVCEVNEQEWNMMGIERVIELATITNDLVLLMRSAQKFITQSL